MSWKTPKALDLIVSCVWIVFLAYLVIQSNSFGWDLHVYQQAASRLKDGLDPFDDDFRVRIGSQTARLPFIYPPLTLYPFMALASVSKQFAYLTWLVIDLFALWSLNRIWCRSFLGTNLDGRWAAFQLLAFNASVYTCFATGNIALLEALVIFLAMEALLAKKDFRCASWILLASLFKIVPILLLAFLIWKGGENRVRAAAYGFLGFLVFAGANFALLPKLSIEFFYSALARSDNRINNPSLLAFFDDLSIRAPILNGRILYLAAVSVVLVVSYNALKQWKLPPANEHLLFAMLTLSILLPRFMIYSYMQLIPISWLAIQHLRGNERLWLAGAVCMLLPGSYLLISHPNWSAAYERALGIQAGVWGYASLYAGIAIWTIYVFRVMPGPKLNNMNV